MTRENEWKEVSKEIKRKFLISKGNKFLDQKNPPYITRKKMSENDPQKDIKLWYFRSLDIKTLKVFRESGGKKSGHIQRIRNQNGIKLLNCIFKREKNLDQCLQSSEGELSNLESY